MLPPRERRLVAHDSLHAVSTSDRPVIDIDPATDTDPDIFADADLPARDLVDIPASVKNGLEIVPVSRMDQVLQHALVRMPTPIEWDEPPPPKTPAPAVAEEDQAGVIAH